MAGSIKKRDNGKWRARYRDETGREHARHFDRRTDAQQWLDEQTASLQTGTWIDPRSKTTVREYGEQWRAEKAQMGHRPSTAYRIGVSLEKYVYPHIGSKPIRTVTPRDIERMMASASSVLAPRTVRVLHAVVASMFTDAIGDRLVATNPCERTAKKLPKPASKTITPLTVEQVQALADVMPGHLRAAVLVAAATGLRPGELFGLTVDRVDFLRRRLTVDRQLQTPPGRGTQPVLVEPKTPESYREIRLTQYTVDDLAAHLQAYPASADGLIFHRPDGKPLSRGLMSDVMRRARGKVDVPATTSWHALRHHHASLLIDQGATVKYVQERLGHASPSITLDVYAHLFEDSDDKLIEKLETAHAGLADSVRTGTDSGG